VKRFLMLIALSSLLSSPALAGDIPSVGAPTPSQRGAMSTPNSTSPGDVPTVGRTDQLSLESLSAFLSVLGLLAV
jgi:hypothetical protein